MKQRDSAVVSRAMELYRVSEYEAAATDFLTPGEQAEIYNELNARIGSGMSRCFFWGGCRGAERCAAVFLPEWRDPGPMPPHRMPPDEARKDAFARYLAENPDLLGEIPITALSVKGSGFRELGHRDFMGSILSLGVERSVVGDIVPLTPSEARVYVSARIAPFLCEQLTKIGRDGVKTEALPPDPEFLIPRQFEELTVIVSSPRLDGVVKALTGQSREAAAEAVRAGLAEVNYVVAYDVARELAPGDILSVRGWGKCVIGEVSGTTRSGRIRMSCRKYR